MKIFYSFRDGPVVSFDHFCLGGVLDVGLVPEAIFIIEL